MKWFRFYDEALDDPKVQRLSATMFRHWVNLLCLANRNPNRGTLPPLSDIAFGLRVNERKAQQIVDELVAVGLIDQREHETYEPHGWRGRQRTSDNVAERVAKHRSRNNDETLQETRSKQNGNVTETPSRARATETETETETEKTSADAPEPDPPPGVSTLPANGPAQQIVKAFCESVGIDKPASYSKAVGQAQQLAQAGVKPEDIPDAVAWCREQKWLKTGFDLGSILANADKWRAARRAASTSARRLVV